MFVGRTDILARMESLWQKATPSLVTIRGRRRIGKSTLVSEFAKRTAAHFISIDGQAPGEGVNNAVQLRSFVEQLSSQTNAPNVKVENWLQAFRLLDNALPREGRTVVLLDEISWMGGFDVSFPGTLKIVWDKCFKLHDNLVVVLCGSVSSWIAENILNGTGFVGRDSLDVVLEELPINECAHFWRGAESRTSVAEKIDFLSVTGGVPKYLEELDPTKSAEANIRELCFTRTGLLFRDFEQIFNKIFGKKSADRLAILKTVSNGSKSLAEIAEALGKERNGHLGDYLEELCLAGFLAKDVSVNPQTGRVGKIALYRLKDNYSRFYLHHVAPYAREIEAGLFRSDGLTSLPGWNVMKGLQFENLIVANYRLLLPILGIDGASLLSAAPYRRGRSGDEEGVQIDLLIQTRTTSYVVEVKRRGEIGTEVAGEISEKICRIGFPKQQSVRTVLVYEGNLAGRVRTDHLVDFIVPAERFFGL